MKILLILLIGLFTQMQAQTLIESTIELTKKYEGYSKNLYIDSNGYSIGYGTNLVNGINKEEALLLLKYRLKKVNRQLSKYSWFNNLSKNRKIALIDLGYNLGIQKLLTFHSFIWCIKNGYYHAASNALRNSLWYKQVGNRSKRICAIIY